MRAGLLNRLVLIETRSNTQEGSGDQVDTWTTHAQVYARIEPLSGEEKAAAGALQNVGVARITIRYVAGVTPAMRVNDNGTYYQITAPPRNVGMKNRELQFEAEEGVRNG